MGRRGNKKPHQKGAFAAIPAKEAIPPEGRNNSKKFARRFKKDPWLKHFHKIITEAGNEITSIKPNHRGALLTIKLGHSLDQEIVTIHVTPAKQVEFKKPPQNLTTVGKLLLNQLRH